MILDFVDTNFIIVLLVAVMTGAAAGLLGTFMVLRRMSLVGDALSHVALPGIALALMFDINPFLGALAILVLAIAVIWLLEERTEIPIDALVGVFFTAALAVGVIIFPEHDLLEALFGDVGTINLQDGIMALGFLAVTIIVLKLISKTLLLDIVSKDLASITNKRRAINNLIFLVLIASVVALGLKVVGVLLMGAMIIIPAAAGKNISRSFSQYLIASVFVGAFSGAAGILLSRIYEVPPGPAVAGVAVGIFLITLFFRRK
jgi:ABC-type Mn2+/Zn2+ transport system permease subunit